MKITNLKTTIVCVPFCKVYPWRLGEANGITAVLAEVTTDTGLVGIGESPCFFPSAEGIKAAMDSCTPFLLGEDPFDHERIYKRILAYNGLYYDRVFAGLTLSGIDLALWDLMGKAANQPLYKLLGGRVHQEARFICIVPLAEPPKMAEAAQRAVGQGCHTLYVKYDGDEQQLIDRLQAIRAAIGPKPNLRLDFNQGLTPGFAVKFIRELERFGLETVEQPCGEEDLAGLRYIKDSISTPVISDESSKTFYHAYNTIKAEAADIIQIDPFTTDGLWGVRKACGIAEAAGLPVVFHCIGELGLNQMKIVHLAVSTPNATIDHQTLYDYNSDDVIIGGLLAFDHWTMKPSSRSGLGVELDRNKVNQYAELYKSQGGRYITGRHNLEGIKHSVPLISGVATTRARFPGG
jgi:L-alanine-DL-glutamate epimerase-like enolase superfamily enzyme